LEKSIFHTSENENSENIFFLFSFPVGLREMSGGGSRNIRSVLELLFSEIGRLGVYFLLYSGIFIVFNWFRVKVYLTAKLQSPSKSRNHA